MSVLLLALCALSVPSSVGAVNLRARHVAAESNSSNNSGPCNETLTGAKGSGYRGCQTLTRSGKTCQKWTSQTPQKHSNTPSKKPGKGLGDHNSCRNPDGEDTIWCYTTDPSKRWQYCDTIQSPQNADGSAIAANASLTTAWKLSICGKLPTYGNAKPQNFADQMATFFNKVTKKREAKLYKTGDTVTFECLKGFTIDGSMTGAKTFDAKCKGVDVPYFAPGGVCIQASKCGAVPSVADATSTTTKVKGGVEFACNPGYSLDGEKVVAGGMQKNVLFTIKCIEFSNKYEVFKGKCKSYKFMASGPAIAMTTNVFEALFTVNCKGRMVDSFGKFTSGNVTTAPTVDCTKITTASALTAANKTCAEIVTDITTVFVSKKTAYLAAKDSPNREWFDKNTTDPNVETESMAFCKEMWGLTQKKMPAAAQVAR